MTAKELRNQIATLQTQLSVLVASEKTAKVAELTAKFSQVSTLKSCESDGLREWEHTLKVFHSGLDFELEEQGLCAVVEE